MTTTALQEATVEQVTRPLIRYYGGKWMQRHWLCPLLESIPHTTYCAPFGGAAGDILGRSRPAPVECWNDIDEHLANLFRVLRDRDQRAEFLRKLHWTPYGQAEVAEASRILREADGRTQVDPATLAWAVYVRAWTSLMGTQRPGMTFGYVHHLDNTRSYAPDRFRTAKASLPAIARRVEHLQLFCEDWRRFVGRFDGVRNVLFYCDPPYPQETRRTNGDFRYDTSEALLSDLQEWALGSSVAIAVSSYPGEWMNGFAGAGWELVLHDVTIGAGVGTDGASRQRTEVVALSPEATRRRDLAAAQQRLPLGT